METIQNFFSEVLDPHLTAVIMAFIFMVPALWASRKNIHDVYIGYFFLLIPIVLMLFVPPSTAMYIALIVLIFLGAAIIFDSWKVSFKYGYMALWILALLFFGSGFIMYNHEHDLTYLMYAGEMFIGAISGALIYGMRCYFKNNFYTFV